MAFTFLTISTDPHGIGRRLAIPAATLLWAVALGWLTLRPDPAAAEAAAASPWWCLLCGEAGAADFLLNAVLFLPLGALLSGQQRRVTTALLSGLVIALAIEIAQGLWIAGRDPALGDVVANTAGSVAGWIAWSVPIRSGPGRSIACLSLVAFAAQLGVTGWMASAAPDGVRPWRLHNAPDIAGRENYPGLVVAVRLRDSVLYGTGHATTDAPASDLRAAFTWTPSPTADTRRAVLRLVDDRGWLLAAIDSRGKQIIGSIRLRASHFRLRTPTWSVVAPSSATPGDTLGLELSIGHGRAVARLVGHGDTTEHLTRFGAQHGWSLLNPWSPLGGREGWDRWTLGWLCGWGLLLGMAAGIGRGPLPMGALAILALVIATTAFGTPVTPAELAALVVGWVGGVSSGRLRRSPVSA
jgi:hypothetical protein